MHAKREHLDVSSRQLGNGLHRLLCRLLRDHQLDRVKLNGDLDAVTVALQLGLAHGLAAASLLLELPGRVDRPSQKALRVLPVSAPVRGRVLRQIVCAVGQPRLAPDAARGCVQSVDVVLGDGHFFLGLRSCLPDR